MNDPHLLSILEQIHDVMKALAIDLYVLREESRRIREELNALKREVERGKSYSPSQAYPNDGTFKRGDITC